MKRDITDYSHTVPMYAALPANHAAHLPPHSKLRTGSIEMSHDGRVLNTVRYRRAIVVTPPPAPMRVRRVQDDD